MCPRSSANVGSLHEKLQNKLKDLCVTEIGKRCYIGMTLHKKNKISTAQKLTIL